MTNKKIEDSLSEQMHIIMYSDINGDSRLFGGKLLSWIDELAGIVAKRHSQHKVTTAAIDNLQFKESALINDIVIIIGRITYVGNTSMEVRVDSYVENMEGLRRPINRAYLTMVAVDDDGHPVKVPSLIIETESQRAEFEGAKKRIAYRKQRRSEGF
ncbi:MAG: acyl-CoA thioesterase [Lachnotalea sp.]